MLTISEINKIAEKAIDDTYAHYFVHLASGVEKQEEIKFIIELLKMMQPWLFFTETALEEQQDFIYKDKLHINLIYTLTAIFHQRFAIDESDYKNYIKHISTSFNTHASENEKLSMMAKEYRDRLIGPEAVEVILTNNRPLVMLVSTMLYLDTNILIQATVVKK